MGKPRKNQGPDRESIADAYDQKMGVAPEVEEAQPEPTPEKQEKAEVQEKEQEYNNEAPIEDKPTVEPAKEEKRVEIEVSPEMAEWAKSKGFDLDEIKSSKTLFNSIKSQIEAEKKMHAESSRSAQMEQEFSKLKDYIDWDRLKGDVSGRPKQEEQPSPKSLDKEEFFQKFADQGPSAIDDYLLRHSPVVNQRISQSIKEIVPILTQSIAFRLKVDEAYTEFKEKYPHLQALEEDVGKIMFKDLSQNPRKNLKVAMNDAAKQMQKVLDDYKEQGKKEADTIHEERRRDNIPPGDKSSKDRGGPIKPKAEEDENKPETADEYMKWRRGLGSKSQTKVGYEHRR